MIIKNNKKKPVFAIAGAGFSGASVARYLVENLDCLVEVYDKRDHLAGNCFTYRDASTGVMVHAYGPHIFNTSDEDVWAWVQRFCIMMPYINRVKAVSKNKTYSFPINLHTLNQFFDSSMSPTQAADHVKSVTDKNIDIPQNFEQQALSMIGEDLYRAFFYGYTKKQWGCEPSSLPASILKRIPIRFNYNDNYYNSRFQGIPKDGYSDLVSKMLNHPSISIKLDQELTRKQLDTYDHCFWSGQIDKFFNYEHGSLSYRTVYWERQIVKGDFQGNAVINYCDENITHTRILEHKHLAPWEEHEDSIIFTEFSKETDADDQPFYPIRLPDDMVRLKHYQSMAKEIDNISFIGRLGTYRYLNMDQTIAESISLVKSYLQNNYRSLDNNA